MEPMIADFGLRIANFYERRKAKGKGVRRQEAKNIKPFPFYWLLATDY